MNGKIAGILRIDEMMGRLSELCSRLWKDNNPAAVALQSLLEEFRPAAAAVGRIVPEYEKSVKEQADAAGQRVRKECDEKLSSLESKLADSARSLAEAETRLLEYEKKVSELKASIEAKNRELEESKAGFPRIEADFHSKYAVKMQELYGQVSRKEAELAAFWESRHKAVDEKAQAFEKQQREKMNELDLRAKSQENDFAARKDELFRAFDKLRKELEAKETALSRKEEMLDFKENELAQIEDRLKKGKKVTTDQ